MYSSRWDAALWIQDLVGDVIGVESHLALPDPHHRPSVLLGQPRGALVSIKVAPHLVDPELGVRPGPGRLASVFRAAMPEATVHEHGHLATRQHEVGRASLRDLPVQPEPAASGMDRLAEEQLGDGVRFAPAGEVPSSLGANPTVRHLSNLRRLYPRFVPQ